MYRKILEYLKLWQVSTIRTPLIVRGARQVGKSYVIREFGQTQFRSILEINLETQPEFLACFDRLDAKKICADIEAIANIALVPGHTLLFIDEIQTSENALLSLRSFKESMPGLHVIAAGSLLEFALQENRQFSFPVGRVTFAYLQPFSFLEFLAALGEHRLSEAIVVATLDKPCSKAVHEKLLDLLRTYFAVGGMPEAIGAYVSTGSLMEARRVQNRLVTGFIADFAKYGRRYDHRKLQQLLAAVPRLVGHKFKFSHVNREVSARDFRLPLLDLERAGLIRIVRASGANGVPLGGEEREGIFKALSVDVGLMLNALGLSLLDSPVEKALFVNEGALAEQFVGQELLAHADAESHPSLYYWLREMKGAEAEVDYVMDFHGVVVSIEVKAGATGRLKSLRQFMNDKKSKIGLRISQHQLSVTDDILSLPLYMCSEVSRIIAGR